LKQVGRLSRQGYLQDLRTGARFSPWSEEFVAQDDACVRAQYDAARRIPWVHRLQIQINCREPEYGRYLLRMHPVCIKDPPHGKHRIGVCSVGQANPFSVRLPLPYG
jgi:hypothetical protein